MQVITGAHDAGSEITCLQFARDDQTLISRADGTLKVLCALPNRCESGSEVQLKAACMHVSPLHACQC